MEGSRQVTIERIICCCLAAIVVLLAGGCSSLKVVETWHKPAVSAHHYQKVMILGIGRNENLRQLFENLVVEELQNRQVVAIPSYTVIPDLEKTTHAAIVAAIRTSGCDAVLTARALSVGDNTVTQEGQGSVYGAGTRSSYDFLRATLQTNLYDAATEELVWSSAVTTFDADRKVRVGRELGRFYFESLRHIGML